MIRDQLHRGNIYQLFKPMPAKVFGWGSDDPNFKLLIDEVQPKLIVEVGTWLGASAIHMASLAPEAEVVCIDTWLGADEFWTSPSDATRDLMFKNGYPGVYYQFLSNVYHSDAKDRITPMPMPSRMASRMLALLGAVPDMIYIDGSHHYEDVLDDLRHYWPLLRRGGVMFGDDYFTFMDVRHAVEAFCAETGATHTYTDRQWVMRK